MSWKLIEIINLLNLNSLEGMFHQLNDESVVNCQIRPALTDKLYCNQYMDINVTAYIDYDNGK